MHVAHLQTSKLLRACQTRYVHCLADMLDVSCLSMTHVFANPPLCLLRFALEIATDRGV